VHLARLYRREGPDIVHHVALKPVIYGSLVARIVGTRGIVNALGGLGYVFFSAGFRAKVLRSIARPVLRWLLNAENTRLIVQNTDDEQRLVAAGVAKVSSIQVIRGSGVDPDAYRQVAVTTDEPLVVFPARFLREKGIIEFVGAARMLREQGVKARFALVGRPDPANPTSVSQAEVERWVGEGFVEAWGWRDDMPAVFSQAQIVCLPSYHEGLPKSLLEAAASGCAIVTTDIPGCREVAQPGKTGWLVPPQDTLALVKALQHAIEQPGLRQQYGMSARALVASDFSISRVAKETIAVYQKLLTRDITAAS
jgi:glycosyltransferase involved in cell wall biosynthesis